MDGERLWTKDFITVALASFSLYLVFYLLMITIPSYAVDKFGASTGMAGLVSGIFIIGILTGRLGTGHIIEGSGPKRILLIGCVCFAVTSLFYFVTFNLPVLAIVRLLHGIAFGITSNAAGTIAAHIIPLQRRGEGISYYSLSMIMAAALGPFVGILLMQHSDFRIIFIIASILPVVSLGIASTLGQPTVTGSDHKGVSVAKGFLVSNYIEYKSLPISIIILVIGAAYSAVLIFLSLYTRHIHLEKTASFFFPVYAATVIVSRPFSGRLLDKKGANYVVYPCLLIFAFGMLLFSQAESGIILLLAAVVIGIGYGNFLSIGHAVSVKVVPSYRLGLATSTFFMCLDLGLGAGPYILGSLVPFTGYRGIYVLMAGVILTAMALYYLLHGKRAIHVVEPG